MRRLGCALLIAASACGTNLAVPNNLLINCGAAGECPDGYVCVTELGRCLAPGAACVSEVGGRLVPAAEGNVCDAGGLQGTCRGGLCLNTCGDGFRDPQNEACDDGNGSNDDACTNTCELNVCGDRFVNIGVEACDDGNDDANDGCHACSLAGWSSAIVVEAKELAGGPLTLGLSRPVSLTHDGAGNLYFADAGRNLVYRRDAATSLVTAIAGTGDTRPSTFYPGIAPTQLTLGGIGGIAATADGTVFFSETSTAQGTARIYRIKPNGDFEVYAGVGPRCDIAVDPNCGNGSIAELALLRNPGHLAWDESSQSLYFTDRNTVRVVSGGYVYHVLGDGRSCIDTGVCPECPRNGIGEVSAACGEGGPAEEVPIMRIDGLAVAADGTLYYSDAEMHRVRRVDPVTSTITTVFGTGSLCTTQPSPFVCGDGGPGIAARINSPSGLAVASDGALYVADSASAGRLRVVRDGVVTTYAGETVSCFVVGNCLSNDGPRATTQFFRLTGMSFDPAGRLHVIDELNRIIRVIVGDVVTTELGNRTPLTNPAGREAISANLAAGLTAVDGVGNLFVVVSGFIFRVDAVTGLISHVAGIGVGSDGFPCRDSAEDACGSGGPATSAFLGYVTDMVVLDNGQIFISEEVANKVRRIDTDGIIRNVITGVGVGGFDVSATCKLYLTNGNQIGLVTNACTTPSAMTNVAGNGDYGLGTENGAAQTRMLACPSDVAVDPSNDATFVIADLDNCRVRRVVGGVMSTLVAGTASDCTHPAPGPNGTTPQDGCGQWLQSFGAVPALPFTLPYQVRYASDGTLFIRDFVRSATLRRASNGTLTNYFPLPPNLGGIADHDAGDTGPFTSATFNSVGDVTHDKAGNTYVSTFGGRTGRVRRIDGGSGTITTLIGADLGATGPFTFATVGNALEMTMLDGSLLVASGSMRQVRRVDFARQHLAVVAGYTNGAASTTTPTPARYSELFGNTSGIAADAANHRVYVVDESANTIRVIDATGASPAAWQNSTYVPNHGFGFLDGAATAARFSHPMGIAFDAPRRRLLVADSANHVIRAIAVDSADRTVSTIAGTPAFSGASGDGGPASDARLTNPRRLALASEGTLYIVDTGNRRIRRVAVDGTISTVLDYSEPIALLGDTQTRLDVTDVRGIMVDSHNNLWLAAGAYVLILGGDGDAPTTGGLPALVYGADRSAPPESLTSCISALVEDGETVLAADACAGVLVRLTRS